MKRRFLGLLPIVHENFWRAREPSFRRETAGDLRPSEYRFSQKRRALPRLRRGFPRISVVGLLRVSATLAMEGRPLHRSGARFARSGIVSSRRGEGTLPGFSGGRFSPFRIREEKEQAVRVAEYSVKGRGFQGGVEDSLNGDAAALVLANFGSVSP